MDEREIDEMVILTECEGLRFKTEIEVLNLVKRDVEGSINRLACLLNFFPNYPQSIQILRDLHLILHGPSGVKKRIQAIRETQGEAQ